MNSWHIQESPIREAEVPEPRTGDRKPLRHVSGSDAEWPRNRGYSCRTLVCFSAGPVGQRLPVRRRYLGHRTVTIASSPPVLRTIHR